MSTSEITNNTNQNSYEQRDPDVRLMLQVRDDDALAFEELMLRYQNRVVTVLEHLVGRRGQAEDLAQDVFLRVYRARKNYTPTAKFTTWLFTITNNVALNALRSQSRKKEVNIETMSESGSVSVNPLEHLAQDASGLMPTRQIEKSEMRSVVRMALSGLNERQRMAILLNKFEHMSYADIAETMEMSPQAIKSLLSRARLNLKEILQPYLDEGVQPNDSDNLKSDDLNSDNPKSDKPK